MKSLDFPLILSLLTIATGLVWLADVLFLRARRLAAAGAGESVQIKSGDSASGGGAVAVGLPEEPYLIELCRSFFPVLAVVLVLRSFLLEPFQIPSGSMLPTLEEGDFILVNKFNYGLRLPVLGTKILAMADPQRGDVMVFRYPVDQKTNYIKRVVGLPGDRIRYRNKQLFINDELISREFLVSRPPEEVYNELLGSKEHLIQQMGGFGSRGEGEWEVPDGHYFVMGDNRDNSNDSRYWGFVADEFVVGRAFAVWMHWKSVTSLPGFGRVGVIE